LAENESRVVDPGFLVADAEVDAVEPHIPHFSKAIYREFPP